MRVMCSPQAFSLENTSSHRLVHAGVLEFTSDELNKAFLPLWMFEHLNVGVGVSCDHHVIVA